LSSITPACRSASIAICRPGIASNVNRAVTSEMRTAPWLMTTNWMTMRTRKTTMPTTKLPPTTNSPKAMITLPAALVPSWPCIRMSRVDATLSDSRRSVRSSSSEGKTENSTGCLT
jgi:hypothetical protein